MSLSTLVLFVTYTACWLFMLSSVDGSQGVSLSWTSLWMSLLCPHTTYFWSTSLFGYQLCISNLIMLFPNACSCEIHSTCRACYLCTGSGQKPGSHPSLINFFHCSTFSPLTSPALKYTWTLTTAHRTIAPSSFKVHHPHRVLQVSFQLLILLPLSPLFP